MNRQERLVGYICVIAILFLAVWAVRMVHREFLHSDRVIRVRFPELGTLLTEAPLVEDGAPIGNVRRLTLQDGRPLAEIELFHRNFIASDARFINFNHSLMGDRMVVLQPGHSGIPMDESRIQDGIFADGVAETMRRVNELLDLVIELRTQTGHLFAGPGAVLSPGLLTSLKNEAISLNLLANRIDAGGKSLHTGLEAWVQTRNSIQKKLESADSNFHMDENRTDHLLAATFTAEHDADGMLISVERVLNSLEDSGGAVRSVLYDRNAYEDLKRSLQMIETALRAFQEKGLDGAVRWRTLHFFRSKSP